MLSTAGRAQASMSRFAYIRLLQGIRIVDVIDFTKVKAVFNCLEGFVFDRPDWVWWCRSCVCRQSGILSVSAGSRWLHVSRSRCKGGRHQCKVKGSQDSGRLAI